MFNEIYYEKDVKDHPITNNFIKHFSKLKNFEIDKLEDYWGRVKKPYLQKRKNLNIYIGKKKGQYIKEAPDAYGVLGSKHYYFIHAYNCIYECEYCYLQGYFNTPDLVIFTNHDDIIKDIELAVKNSPEKEIWFHAGEFSDSLALSHLTNEIPLYREFFAKHPNAYLELRTKSANTKALEKVKPLENMVISYSLAPAEMAKAIDHKTPSTKARLKAMQKLDGLGFKLGLHLDPTYYYQDFEKHYRELALQIEGHIDISKLKYISIGVVRFAKETYKDFSRNYPDSILHQMDMIKAPDGKVRYNRPMRMWMMNTIKDIFVRAGHKSELIYFCMEEENE
jgi:spore photoproduct lyase